MEHLQSLQNQGVPWNKGKLVGQRPALKLQEIWAIRIRLEISQKIQELALFNLAIDSKLRSCDLVKLKVSDISNFGSVSSRAMVVQQKTKMPVQFEITPGTRDSLKAHISNANLVMSDYLFKSRRRYSGITDDWALHLLLSVNTQNGHIVLANLNYHEKLCSI